MPAKQGAKHHAAVLTVAKVRQARKSFEVVDKKTGKRKNTVAGLARKYGVSHQAMWSAIHHKTWKHVS